MRKYGLIGSGIEYSYSKLIHEYLIAHFDIDASYELIDVREINKELLKQYDGLNVTRPFKETVIKYLDINNSDLPINTIMKKDDKLIGFNTDIDGFDYLIKNNRINRFIDNIEKVIIMGDGATSKMIQHYFKDKEILVIARRDPLNNFSMIKNLKGDLLINTTPIGMNEYCSPISDEDSYAFKNIIDVNYNPLNSQLRMQAHRSNSYFIGGLDMLLVQALKSFAVWHNIDASYLLDNLKKHIFLKTQSKIALIGYPLSGKSTLVNSFNGCDLDEKIIKRYGSINDLIKNRTFREKETIILTELVNNKERLIACGGGIILKDENMELLKDYLIINVVTKRHILQKRMKNNTRPLLENKEDFNMMYTRRRKLYLKYANVSMTYEEVEEFLDEFRKNN
ncbi:MAG: hypothetical protein LBT75_05635 [Bacilli bacterium]|nr:hypothetical protein [Bacilli bacterium]